MNFTTKEIATIKILIRLGDSEELATETVIANRPIEAKKQAQHIMSLALKLFATLDI